MPLLPTYIIFISIYTLEKSFMIYLSIYINIQSINQSISTKNCDIFYDQVYH